MLLRLPAHQLTRLGFLHALDLNLLDDHVAAADGGHDFLGFYAGIRQRRLDRLRDDAGVHDLALDDRICLKGLDRDPRELRLTLGVIDDRDLDEARADIETVGAAFATEECHGGEKDG